MNKKMLIGVITTDCHSEYQSEIIRGIISQAFKIKCNIAVLVPLNNYFFESVHKEAGKDIFNLILSDKFDGFMYDRNSFQNENIRKFIDDLCTRSGKPVMLIDNADQNIFETTVVDDGDAFEIITDHLIDVHGYRKIYCLTGPKGVFCAEERLKGYIRSMKKHGLNIDKSHCIYGDFWTAAAIDLASEIINGKIDKPDAIVCGNDYSALALSTALSRRGIQVPEDIAITGYDASMEGYSASPSITSYKRPNFQLGADSFKRLYHIITGKICSRVPMEFGEIRIGKSCGCAENPQLRHDILRKIKINETFESHLLYGDMLFEITNVDRLSDLIDILDRNTYLLHKISKIYICITEKFKNFITDNSMQKLDFNTNDNIKIILDKSSVKRDYKDSRFPASDILPDFNENKKLPSAFYISPIQNNGDFFGYAAVSFGKHPITYNRLYIQWIKNLSIAFEHLKTKSILHNTSTLLDIATNYDQITDLLNRTGLESVFLDKIKSIASQDSSGKKLTYIHIELSEVRKTYYQCGEEKTNQIIRSFAESIKSCINENEICGTVTPGSFGILTTFENRAKSIFELLQIKIQQSVINSAQNCNVAFTVGTYTPDISSTPNFADCIYKAAVNKTFSYTKADINANPQFEKLCMLRNKIIKNPEISWNITEIADEMFLSKSYLQKMYKTFFNKSIIEEMIESRLDKAKLMLIDTDETITDIARLCGYSSYNYFVKQFRNSEGISPSEYREYNKKEA